MEIKVWSNPKYTNNETKPISIDIQPGLTMLIGPNGCGKTTTLKQINSVFYSNIWSKIEDNKDIRKQYYSFLYDNMYEEKNTKDSWLYDGYVDRIVDSFHYSEGQDMYNYLYYKLKDIIANVDKAKQRGKKGIFLLFDGLDSGLSLNVIEELRSLVNKYMEKTITDTFKLYVVCTANSYEFCNTYDCIDVRTQGHIKFTDYEAYREYMLRKEQKENV